MFKKDKNTKINVVENKEIVKIIGNNRFTLSDTKFNITVFTKERDVEGQFFWKQESVYFKDTGTSLFADSRIFPILMNLVFNDEKN